jgi:hypothetical protein
MVAKRCQSGARLLPTEMDTVQTLTSPGLFLSWASTESLCLPTPVGLEYRIMVSSIKQLINNHLESVLGLLCTPCYIPSLVVSYQRQPWFSSLASLVHRIPYYCLHRLEFFYTHDDFGENG